MTFMDAVRVVEAEHATVIGSKQMRQKEGKIVANDQVLLVNPNLFTHDTGPTRTPKLKFVVGLLAQARLSSHLRILVQVMHPTQQL
jgi:hypothetical protein